MPRLTRRYVIVCDDYRTDPFTHLEQAELGLASIEREGECTLPHHIEEV